MLFMYRASGACTLATIFVTVVFSFTAFARPELEERFIFDPERVLAWKQYYRLVTSGFLHADWRHLALNMVSLYFFGPVLELLFGVEQFLAIYLGSIVGGNLLSLYVHRHHEYRAYGASGGVCGLIFAHILLWPGGSISFFMFPVGIPGWLYAILFMAGSFYAMKARNDNIGHDAHLGGAIVGLLITAALQPDVARHNWQIFCLVLGAAVALLIYLWVNPLMLSPDWQGPFRATKARGPNAPQHKREEVDLDAVLEKVAAHGMNSLDEEELARLHAASEKLQRRSQSTKPKSGLTI
jgi:membrane associated rhomboid family serine protease